MPESKPALFDESVLRVRRAIDERHRSPSPVQVRPGSRDSRGRLLTEPFNVSGLRAKMGSERTAQSSSLSPGHPLVFVDVKISNSPERTARVCVRSGEDVWEIAKNFALRYELEETAENALLEHLMEAVVTAELERQEHW